MTGRCRHGLGHVPQPDAVGIERDLAGRPIEAILVIASVGLEREVVHVEGRRAGGVVARFLRGGRLQDEIDGPARGVELGREELEVDLFRVVEILDML